MWFPAVVIALLLPDQDPEILIMNMLTTEVAVS